MSTYSFGFAEITRIEDDIFEIVVAPTVEIDRIHAARIHAFFDEHFAAPACLLINKKHDYSLSLAAMRNVGSHPMVRGIAYLLFRPSTAKIVELQQKLMINRSINVASFWERDAAIQWLREHRALEHRLLQA